MDITIDLNDSCTPGNYHQLIIINHSTFSYITAKAVDFGLIHSFSVNFDTFSCLLFVVAVVVVEFSSSSSFLH